VAWPVSARASSERPRRRSSRLAQWSSTCAQWGRRGARFRSRSRTPAPEPPRRWTTPDTPTRSSRFAAAR
jgi:hypothetical protein